MAFHQRTLVAPGRVSALNPPITARDSSPSTRQTASQYLQEWVLFSPSQVRSLSQAQSASTTHTPRSADLSRLSDFGSFNTLNRSRRNNGDVSESTEAAGDDEDLDSLDEGLHAFQDPLTHPDSRFFDGIGPVLPKHDGFGTFPASSAPVQEQLRQFEQYNARKRSAARRGTSSLPRQLDAILHNDIVRVSNERIARIELWRMEQSKILLDSIQREAGRRSISPSRCRVKRKSSAPVTDTLAKEFFRSSYIEHVLNLSGEEAGELKFESNDSMWERITRRIIHDLLGIDDALLSVIFGESLPAESSSSEASSTSLTSDPRLLKDSRYKIPATGWQSRLLDRLHLELGILTQYVTDNPGPFSTSFNPSNLDYAGLSGSPPHPPQDEKESSAPPPRNVKSSSSVLVKPTLDAYPSRVSTCASDTTHAALWGFEEEIPVSSPSLAAHDCEYWERTPDLSSIFRVLHHRFSSRRPLNSTPNIAITANPAFLHRTAVIRQHHPLVSLAVATASRRSRNAGFHQYPHHYRCTESSCKSQNLRKGARVRSGSSRNYWDLGGASHGGSAGIALAGGGGGALGSWGEV